jgi:GDSL-like Lipase/Acylhydrolase family
LNWLCSLREGARGRRPLAPPSSSLPQPLKGKKNGRQAGAKGPNQPDHSAGREGGPGGGQGQQAPGPPPGLPPARRKNFFERHPKKTLTVLVVLALLVLAFIADKIIGLKVTSPGPSVQRYVRLRELSPLTFEVITPPPKIFDTEAGSKPRPVYIRVDEQGFLMPSRVHAHPDLVLAFLGGSTTECRVVPEENRFPYLVGRRLEGVLQVKVNSYNAARSGNNSLHSLNILLHKLMPIHPDIVVMMHNINDLVALLYEKTYWNNNASRKVLVELRPTLTGQVRGFFQVLREYTIPNLYRAMVELAQRIRGKDEDQDEFRHIRGRKVEIDRPYLLQEFRSNLQMFVDMCRDRQITPVLMTQPNRLSGNLDPKTWKEVKVLEAQGISFAEFEELHGLFNQAIRDVGAKNKVLVVDLAREIPSEDKYVYDPVHLTERASKLAAQVISEKIEPLALARLQILRGGPGDHRPPALPSNSPPNPP